LEFEGREQGDGERHIEENASKGNSIRVHLEMMMSIPAEGGLVK
jgi:hypothetical protein